MARGVKGVVVGDDDLGAAEVAEHVFADHSRAS